MPVLDIIVTHYDEPVSVYGKFFDMLSMQRGIDFNDIQVIVIDDGGDIPFDLKILDGVPYPCVYRVVEHGGISAARNHGIDMAEAEWMMFCDCDDTFSTVYSLKTILATLNNKSVSKRFDMLYVKFWAEDADGDGGIKLVERGINLVFVHGKIYRTSFIKTNGLRFPEDLEFNEDSAFNGVANTIWDYKRTGEINSDTPLYSWCYRRGSLTGTPENLDRVARGLYQRNLIVTEATRQNSEREHYIGMVVRTVIDAYFMLNREQMTPIRKELLDHFKVWYRGHKAEYDECPYEHKKEIKAASKAEYDTGIREERVRWPNVKQNYCKEEVSVTRWLKSLEEGEA